MGIDVIIELLLVIELFISIVLSRINDNKIHILFPSHFALALVTLFISAYWFITGQKTLVDYGNAWRVIERGSLEALTSVMSIAGVSSILLGWIYGERDKITLGKPQIDMIHYVFGPGYAFSLVTHFAATALCIAMAKCAAKEAALWAFLTVVWGCIPQAIICLYIALNRGQREELAIQLWQYDGRDSTTQLSAVRKMAGYLSDVDVRHNKKYCDTLCNIFTRWMLGHYKKNAANYGITAEVIRSVSAIFREIMETIPEAEKESFEDNILKTIYQQLEVDERTTQKEVALNLVCCGYLRFLHERNQNHTNQYLQRAMFFSENDNEYYNRVQDYLYGLNWFQFLCQSSVQPLYYKSTRSYGNVYMRVAFEQLVFSIFEGSEEDIRKYSKLAWRQVYLGASSDDGSSLDVS
ncbi:MAG: hypothetical protein ACI3V4_12830 [Faecousia sp.]